MTQPRAGFFGRIIGAVLGRDLSGNLPKDALSFRSRIATLEMDLAERDARIVRMKQEYEQLYLAREQAEEAAGSLELELFFKKAVAPLSNIAVLIAAAKQGHDVKLGDLVQLVGSLMKIFARAGLEQIGQPGEEIAFESTLHQRMSGGGVGPGKTVIICVPGYRAGNHILLKAMVSSREDA